MGAFCGLASVRVPAFDIELEMDYLLLPVGLEPPDAPAVVFAFKVLLSLLMNEETVGLSICDSPLCLALPVSA